jgi:predicted nuclease of predicted toxin-antitoxin system
VRFLLDEDLSPVAAETARGLGLDALSVHELGRRGYTDREQLELAASDGRICVTRNRDDFILLTVETFQTGAPHAGVLIVPRSLPNHRPERLAHALRRWRDDHPEPGTHFLDFLKAP